MWEIRLTERCVRVLVRWARDAMHTDPWHC
jgi:hypothetical protein